MALRACPFTNFGSLSDGSASVSRNQTTNVTESITYVMRRKHNLTFGLLYRRLQQNPVVRQFARLVQLQRLLHQPNRHKGQPVAGTGFDFADFLLGLPQTSSLRRQRQQLFPQLAPPLVRAGRLARAAGACVNVGLRYEYFAPYTELQGHLANLDVSPSADAWRW